MPSPKPTQPPAVITSIQRAGNDNFVFFNDGTIAIGTTQTNRAGKPAVLRLRRLVVEWLKEDGAALAEDGR